MRAIDLIIFDCDGVLIDSELISAQMLISELSGFGIDIGLEYVTRHFLGRSYPVVLDTIRKDFGIKLPDDFEPGYRRRLMDAFERELSIMPGVRAVLDALAVPYCLATSSSRPRMEHSLRLVGLYQLFEGRTSTASEVAAGKPAPDLFLLAASRMGVAPERCLVIEDSLNGLRAGLAAGMETWRFVGGGHLRGQVSDAPGDALAHHTFASFDAFPHLAPQLMVEGGLR